MQTEKLEQIPVTQIVAIEQVRSHFDDEALRGLAQSLQQVGQLLPIRVRPENDHFIIVDGERRFRAALAIGWTTIAAIVEAQPLDDETVIQKQLIANCQREDLTPLEKAKAIDRLMHSTGAKANELAPRLGMSAASITRSLRLLALPMPIQAAVQNGQISPSAAYELARIDDPQQQQALALQYISGTLTRDGMAGALRTPKAATELPAVSRVCARIDSERTVTVAGPSLCLESFITCLEEVLAKARKVRSQGVGLGTFAKMLRDQTKA